MQKWLSCIFKVVESSSRLSVWNRLFAVWQQEDAVCWPTLTSHIWKQYCHQDHYTQMFNISYYLFLQSVISPLECEDRFVSNACNKLPPTQKNINPLPSGKGFKALGLIKSLGTKGVLELSIFSRNLSCGREIFLAWSSRNVSDWALLWNSPAYLKNQHDLSDIQSFFYSAWSNIQRKSYTPHLKLSNFFQWGIKVLGLKILNS